MATLMDYDEGLKAGGWSADFARHLAREELEQALRVAKQAEEKARDARGRAWALGAVARAQLLANDRLKAQEAAEAAIQAASSTDAETKSVVQRTAAKVYMALFRHADAAEAADAAVALAQESGSKAAEAAALTLRAQVCLSREKKQEAAKVSRQAVALFNECKEQSGEAAALAVVVQACLATKKGSEALRAANEVLGMYQDGSDKEAEARALLLVANTKQALGDAAEAQELAQKAVDIFERSQDPLMQGITLKQLANICFAGGHSIDGWQYAKEALECFREIGHNHGEAAVLCQIANAHVQNGVGEQAVHIAEEGITLCRQSNDRPQLGALLSAVARGHLAQIRLARSDQQEQQLNWKARLAGKEALGILQMVGDRVGEAQALQTLASAFLNYGNAAEARAKAKLAVEIGKEIGNKVIEGENMLLLAQTKIHENKEESARLARLAEKLLREAGASSEAKDAGDVHDFIRGYGKAQKDDKKEKASAAPVDMKSDITVDMDEAKHRLCYFHGFTARAVKPR